MSKPAPQHEKQGRPSQREQILDAAEQLVAEQGAARLTFDALVLKCGVSKGGLLYHFANKDMLLQAMIARIETRFEWRRERYAENFAGDPNAALKSMLLAAMMVQDEAPAVHSAMLAAAANNPDLLLPMRTHMQRLFAEIDASPVGAKGRLLFFAIHGARLFEQLGLCEQACCDREVFAEHLLSLIDDWSGVTTSIATQSKA